jgi:hypothetical protein
VEPSPANEALAKEVLEKSAEIVEDFSARLERIQKSMERVLGLKPPNSNGARPT